MIIDYRSDARNAIRYHVFTAEGECLDCRYPIFYADDDAGIIRHYVKKDGVYLLNEDRTQPQVVELKIPIKLIRKSPEAIRMHELWEGLVGSMGGGSIL